MKFISKFTAYNCNSILQITASSEDKTGSLSVQIMSLAHRAVWKIVTNLTSALKAITASPYVRYRSFFYDGLP
jgi:hypothetical protein